MIYTGQNLHIPHKLMLDWTGWLSDGELFPPETAVVIQGLTKVWASDGLHLICGSGDAKSPGVGGASLQGAKVRGDMAQILFCTSPEVAPTFFSARVKGRLQHALRQAGTPVKFSRKVSVRCLGKNTRADVEGYLGRQVSSGDFADPRFRERMKRYTVEQADLDLSEPAATTSGRYWYNLHVVLVTAGRFRFGEDSLLCRLRDESISVARSSGHAVKSVSIMPDHAHLAIRGNIENSPMEIGLMFQNHLAKTIGCRAWQNEFYVGTFSEYDVGTIIQNPQRNSSLR